MTKLARWQSRTLHTTQLSAKLMIADRLRPCLRVCYPTSAGLPTRLRARVLPDAKTQRRKRFGSNASMSSSISYLGQDQAKAVDEELMGPLGFSIDQLMELAGLSVASSILAEYPPTQYPKVLIVAGPGNNGGDGLVAARHLYHFGYKGVQLFYPKQTDKPLYKGLVTQLKSLNIPMPSIDDIKAKPLKDQFDVVVDSIFGFGFTGAPRPPFDVIIEMMKPSSNPPPLVAVDAPSGWHVEKGDESGDGLRPEMLISLTAPKLGARHFAGRHHYIGGRFIPPQIAEKYNITIPEYPGAAQCVKI